MRESILFVRIWRQILTLKGGPRALEVDVLADTGNGWAMATKWCVEYLNVVEDWYRGGGNI